jgi:hypothetical protein
LSLRQLRLIGGLCHADYRLFSPTSRHLPSPLGDRFFERDIKRIKAMARDYKALADDLEAESKARQAAIMSSGE